LREIYVGGRRQANSKRHAVQLSAACCRNNTSFKAAAGRWPNGRWPKPSPARELRKPISPRRRQFCRLLAWCQAARCSQAGFDVTAAGDGHRPPGAVLGELLWAGGSPPAENGSSRLAGGDSGRLPEHRSRTCPNNRSRLRSCEAMGMEAADPILKIKIAPLFEFWRSRL